MVDDKDIKSDHKEERSDVCRDFLKNICNRGNRCKFYHPSDAPAQSEKEQEIHFCIDFQNRGCHRDNCRFVHVIREEAERYKQTREVNLILARAIAAVSTGDTINGIPVCKEFQTGKCSRGAQRCRYWHVNVEEERERRRRGLPPLGPGPPMGGPMGRGPPRGPMPPFGNHFPGGPVPGFPMRRPLPPDEGPFGEPKRPRMGDAEMRLQEMEKRMGELIKENEGLKREVQREHERYEDLYALFRQQAQGNTGGVSQGVQQQQQQPRPQPTAAPYGNPMGANVWGAPQWSA